MVIVTGNSAKVAAIVGFLIIICGLVIYTCGIVWAAYDGYKGYGIWPGILHLVTGFFGMLSLTKKNGVFTLYLILCVVTVFHAGYQAMTGGLELHHWSKFIGDKKCSMIKGSCNCIGFDAIRIHMSLNSCHKILTINSLFIAMTICCVCGVLLCAGGAIAGFIGSRNPRSQPATLPSNPEPNQIHSANIIPLNYPPNQSYVVSQNLTMPTPLAPGAGYPVDN